MSTVSSIAISSTGIENIKNRLKNTLVNNVVDKVYDSNNVVNIIQQIWVGEDCDRFLESFESKQKEVEKYLNDAYYELEKEFTYIEQEWASFRENNNVVEE